METGSRKILLYRPAQAWLSIAVSVLLLATAGYLSFQLGKRQAAAELGFLQQQRAVLSERLDRRQTELQALREHLAVVERSGEIDRQATLALRDDSAHLQGELLALRKELDFYRGIMAPGDVKPGLRIQNFELEPASEQGLFRYRLTLTQVKRNDRYVRGVAQIQVEGIEDGKTRSLPFTKLLAGDGKALNFRFRYFQHFNGNIRLPDGFQPQRLVISLLPRGKGQPPAVKRTLAWPA